VNSSIDEGAMLDDDVLSGDKYGQVSSIMVKDRRGETQLDEAVTVLDRGEVYEVRKTAEIISVVIKPDHTLLVVNPFPNLLSFHTQWQTSGAETVDARYDFKY
jgi:hypothetical protein